jgi:CBS domain-containing protein
MSHRVRDWMSSPVIVVDPDSSVSYALTLMRRRNIHSLVVSSGEGEKDYGIITTTDIRDKIIALERNPAETNGARDHEPAVDPGSTGLDTEGMFH